MTDYSFTEDDLEIPSEEEDVSEEAVNAPASVVTKDVEMEGVLRLKQGIDIAGKFKGAIQSNNTVNIKEDGCIEGKIDSFNIVVEGEANVEMTARKRLEIRKDGKFFGNLEIQPEVIILSEFATFGKSKEIANSFKTEYVRNRKATPAKA
ncbi:MAG: polymer-forming cytoskeletal protein [Candidatus Omnitrophota bacterium]